MHSGNLIEDSFNALDFFHLQKVCLFVPVECEICSLAAAYALRSFYRSAGIQADVVLQPEDENRLLDCFPRPLADTDIQPAVNDFLAITVDCRDEDDVENDAYNNSYILFAVSPETELHFGVKSYQDPKAVCGAEIIARHILDYCAAHDCVVDRETGGWLYLALLDATSSFTIRLHSQTWRLLQNLAGMDIDTEYYAYCWQKRTLDDMRLLQAVNERVQIDARIATVVLDREGGLTDLPESCYRNCMAVLRTVDDVDIWLLFIENEAGYRVLIQGNSRIPVNAARIARMHGGTGQSRKGDCIIPKDQKDQVIADALQVRQESLDPGTAPEAQQELMGASGSPV